MKKYEVQINHNWCKLCEVCVAICPVKDFKIEGGRLKELGKCTGCMLCVKHCPELALKVKKADEATS